MPIKRYIYKTLSFLGQMYEADGETEANYINGGAIGTEIVLAADYDELMRIFEKVVQNEWSISAETMIERIKRKEAFDPDGVVT